MVYAVHEIYLSNAEEGMHICPVQQRQTRPYSCTFLPGMSRGHKGQRYTASGWIAFGGSRLRLPVDAEILLAH